MRRCSYDGKITKEVADFALNLLEVDRYGLDQIDRRILSTIMVQFSGGPVGLDTLAAAIGEDSGTIEDVYEPYLIKNGFLVRTPRGRVAGDFAYEHLGIDRKILRQIYVRAKRKGCFSLYFDYNRQ